MEQESIFNQNESMFELLQNDHERLQEHFIDGAAIDQGYRQYMHYNPETNTLNFNCNINITPPFVITNQYGADYAEWMKRAIQNEVMQPGDVIGIIGDQGITKTISTKYAASVISTRYALCANLPPKERQADGEVIAFKGQAPIKVVGKVIRRYVLLCVELIKLLKGQIK